MPRTKLRKQNTTKLPTQFDEALIDINKAIEACCKVFDLFHIFINK